MKGFKLYYIFLVHRSVSERRCKFCSKDARLLHDINVAGRITVLNGSSQDESSLVAGTSEGTVVQFQFLSRTINQQDKDWVRTRTFKNHTHDVRALVHTEISVVSGGQL